MNNTKGQITGSGQISRNMKAGLALLIVVATAVGALALLRPLGSPAAMPEAGRAASAAGAQRQEDLKDLWLQRGSANNAISVSAAQRQEELKDLWLQRGSVTNITFVAGSQRQEELKEQWLQRGGNNTSASVSATERQENLKDQWLARKS